MGEMIKEYLVGLGFAVDESSFQKFNKGLASAAVRVTALYASIKVLSAGIAYFINKTAEGFEQMGYELRLIAPAINKTLYLRREMLKAYAKTGVNLREVVKQAVVFNMSLAKTKFALEAIYKSTAAKFFPMLTKHMDNFRKSLYANMPKIQNALVKFVNFVFKAFYATLQFGQRLWSILGRVYDMLEKLHKLTSGWSTVILGIAAAWKFLNLSFIATPIGAIITALVMLLALYDDYMTWQEGGESAFDWTAAVPAIEAFIDQVKKIYEAVKSVFDIFFQLIGLIESLKQGKWSEAGWNLKNIFGDYLSFLKNAKGVIGAINPGAGLLAEGILRLFDNPENAAANVGAATQPNMGTQPIGVGNTTNTSRQNVNQQTTINVQGSANADAVGKAVVGEQSRVNFDMIRNLKGSTR